MAPKPKPKGPGRPVTTGRGHDGERINVRVSAAELATLERAAARDGETVAAWVRRVALRAATTHANRKETRR
jgi:uncharacterized protein (DUF1778 family)